MATKIMPISDLRRQISQVIESLRQESDVIYIKQQAGRRPACLTTHNTSRCWST